MLLATPALVLALTLEVHGICPYFTVMALTLVLLALLTSLLLLPD